MSDQPVPERRLNRLPVPPCNVCHSTHYVQVALRTDYVVYFRCQRCAAVQPMQKRDRTP